MAPPHPYGVEPEGNAWLGGGSVAGARGPGLGALAALRDATLLELLGALGGRDLCALCVASGTLRCYASFEDLWRGVALRRAGAAGAPVVYAERSWKRSAVGRPRARGVARAVYSDALYHPHRLAHAAPLARTLAADDVGGCARRPAAELTVDDFVRDFEAPGVPVVIEGGAAAAAADPLWDRDALVAKFGDREFHVGGYAFALRDFLASVRRRRRRRRDAP